MLQGSGTIRHVPRRQVLLGLISAILCCIAVSAAFSQVSYQRLKSFGNHPSESSGPNPNWLIYGSDGYLYGTTTTAAYKLKADGTEFRVLHLFTGVAGDGGIPVVGLVEATNGSLYGTTSSGGTGWGTIFKLNKDGSGYTVVYQFTGYAPGTFAHSGGNPNSGLIEASDGKLYGTALTSTSLAGPAPGVVYRVNQNGSGYTVLRVFNFNDGAYPTAGLMEGSDGMLYGTTSRGGAGGFGTVFKMNKDGSGHLILHSFDGPKGADGSNPSTQLLEGSDGTLYGATAGDSVNDLGTVYKILKDGSGYTVLHNFTRNAGEGSSPRGRLLEGRDGALIGTTYFGGKTNRNFQYGMGTLFKVNKDGNDYMVLRRFDLTDLGGINPQSSLVKGSNGVLFGAAFSDGVLGGGTLFMLQEDASHYQVLHRFAGVNWDGISPLSSVLAGSDGVLYGTTYEGGSRGYGIVYTLSRDGHSYDVLHRFTDNAGDGSRPIASLVEGAGNLFYGTTAWGGGRDMGTVFKLDKTGGGFSVLHDFGSNPEDGYQPFAGLVEGEAGVFFGTTLRGGVNDAGTIFRVKNDGGGYLVLYSF